jgi:hypothetical protein
MIVHLDAADETSGSRTTQGLTVGKPREKLLEEVQGSTPNQRSDLFWKGFGKTNQYC